MPIITIHAPLKFLENPFSVRSELQERGADALQSTSDNIWVVFESLPDDWPHPVFLNVKALSGRTREIKTAFMRSLTEVLEKKWNISSKNIWIQYEELDPAEIWVGGEWSSTRFQTR